MTSYFADDMVASQTQNGVTNSFELDASRLRIGGWNDSFRVGNAEHGLPAVLGVPEIVIR